MSNLPRDGQAVALDRDAKSLAIAKRYVEKAGLCNLADFRTGTALETLEGVALDYGLHSFDMAFIGAQPASIRSGSCASCVGQHQ